MTELLLSLLGLIILLLGSKLLVESSLFFAKLYKFSKLMTGLFFLSIGSDIPELVISLKGSILSTRGMVPTDGIVLGNALGSIFAQGSLILGLATLYMTSKMTKKEVNFHVPVLIGSCFLLLILYLHESSISRIDGIILLITYITYFFLTYRIEKKKEEGDWDNIRPSFKKRLKYLVYFILGIIGLHYGSELVIDNIIRFCIKNNLSQTVVFFFTIGFGSSIPELMVCLVSAYKGEKGIIIGNIIGSNIFDALFIPGVSSIIYPLYAQKSSTIFYITACTVLSVLLFKFLKRKNGLHKREAIILILLFVFVSTVNIFILRPGVIQ